MKILSSLRHAIGLRSPIRVGYHWLRGFIAFVLSGNPAKGMYIIGITGTKGKTTTSTLIATALEKSGRNVCLLTTAQVWMSGEKSENQSKMTMDSPFKLWKHIRKAKQMGVTHLVLETSSHGIYYFRNFGIRYDIVALTNISQDHLDLHGSMYHYVATKARLFKQEPGKICILPRDCEYLEIFLSQVQSTKYISLRSLPLDMPLGISPVQGDGTNNKNNSDSAPLGKGEMKGDLIERVKNTPGTILVTYSMTQDADYRVTDIQTKTDGMDICIEENTPQLKTQNSKLKTSLVGIFNAENILTAYSTLRTMGIETPPIQDAWEDFTGVPGRMEPVPNTLGLTILVDYAHTETSLKSVLQTLKLQSTNYNLQNRDFGTKTISEDGRLKIEDGRHSDQKIIIVFGATGDRDTTKRPKMGAVVHELADIVVLTDDDTYTEPSARIIEMVRGGIPRTEGDTFQIIPDRKEAIHWALRKAQSGDIVLIAGKGCETVQVTNKGSIPWSDRGIVEEFLK